MKNFIELDAKLKAVPVTVRASLQEMISDGESVMYADGFPVAYIRRHEECPKDIYMKCLELISHSVR